MTHNESTPAELRKTGRASRADAKLLRALQGKATFAEWVDAGARGAHRITDRRLLLICAVRAKAGADARYLARHCPTALLRPVPQVAGIPVLVDSQVPADEPPIILTQTPRHRHVVEPIMQFRWDGVTPLFHYPIGSHVVYPDDGDCRVIVNGGVEPCPVHIAGDLEIKP
jgi:hypothetical protein